MWALQKSQLVNMEKSLLGNIQEEEEEEWGCVVVKNDREQNKWRSWGVQGNVEAKRRMSICGQTD